MAMNGMPRILLHLRSTGAETTANTVLRRGAGDVATTCPLFTNNVRLTPKRNQSTAVASNDQEAEQKRQKQAMRQEKELLLQRSGTLSRSLYRIGMRSVRAIRLGNEHDEKDFREREQDRLEPKEKKDVRLSMLSMLPPVDREDELRSRAEYYMQYMRENFVQESDCLAVDDWQPQHIARYLFHLKRGDEHRKWLLKDMQFQDEYQNAFDYEQVDRFEEQALAFIKKTKDQKEANLSPEIRRHLRQQSDGNTTNHNDGDDDDGFSDDEDDDDDSPPEWYTKNRDRF